LFLIHSVLKNNTNFIKTRQNKKEQVKTYQDKERVLTMNQKGNSIPDEKVDEIEQKTERGRKGIKMKDVIRYSQIGLSCREIGKLLNCTKQSVSYLLIKWENGQVGSENTQRAIDIKDLKDQRKSRFTFPYRKAVGKDKGLLVKDKVETPPPPPTPAIPPKNPGFIFIRR